MTWIKTIPYEEAQGRLKTRYDRVKGRDNNVDNIMMAHSLRPLSRVNYFVRFGDNYDGRLSG